MKNKFADAAQAAGVMSLAEALARSDDFTAYDPVQRAVVESLRFHTQLLIGRLKLKAETSPTPEAEGLVRSMNPKYAPKTLEQKLGYLVEECGETMAAVGKSLRWGVESFNPELAKNERETNRDWVLRELRDLRRAIQFVEDALDEE